MRASSIRVPLSLLTRHGARRVPACLLKSPFRNLHTPTPKLSPHAIEQYWKTIENYAHLKDPTALTRIQELLGYGTGVVTREETFELFETATSLRAPPDVYHSALRLAARADPPDLPFARDIVDYMLNTPAVQTTPETFSLLIQAHKGSPLYREAVAVLDDLRAKDLAEVEHYMVLIELLGGEGELALCIQTYQQYVSAGMPPDATILSALVDVFVRNGEVQRAMQIMAKMRDEDMPWDLRVFNAMLRTCKDNVTKTLTILRSMKSSNITPSSDTLEIVADTVDYQTLLGLWADITKTQSSVPVQALELMLKKCAKEVDLVRINALARDVQKLAYGIHPTTSLINSILRALVQAKESIDKLSHTYEYLLAIIPEPDLETFEVLIVYIASGDFTRALRLFEVMQKRQIKPPQSVCDALLQSVPRSQNHQGVVSTLIKRAAQEGYCLQRKSLERIVELVSQEDMPLFAQIVQRRKAVEDAEEAEYEAEQLRKLEQKQKREEELRQKKEEEKRIQEEEKRKKKEEEKQIQQEEKRKKSEAKTKTKT